MKRGSKQAEAKDCNTIQWKERTKTRRDLQETFSFSVNKITSSTQLSRRVLTQFGMEKSSGNIVIEFGSCFLRGGYAGDNCPLFTIPTPKFNLQKPNRSHLRIQCLEIFRSIFLDHLQIKSKDSQVLIIENMFAPKILREEIFSVLFQEMQVHMVSFQPDLMMACLASGSRSGIVLDISSTECRCLAIAFGTPILSSFTATSVGVSSAEMFFQDLYRSYCTSNDLVIPTNEIMNDLFYRVACTSPSCLSVDGSCWSDSLERHLPADIYDLPKKDRGSNQPETAIEDRKIIVPGWIRSSCLLPMIIGCGHQIFQPSLAFESHSSSTSLEDEIGGAVGAVLSCLLKCNTDLRRFLLQHIIICGGGAAIPGVSRTIAAALWRITSGNLSAGVEEENHKRFDFLQQYSELIHLCPSDCSGINTLPLWTPSIFDRDAFAWVGGSVFGVIKGNISRYVMREEYQSHLSIQAKEWKGGVVGDNLSSISSVASSSHSSPSPSSTNQQLSQASHHRVPDWMSLDPLDWRFYGSAGIHYPSLQTLNKQQPPTSTKGTWTVLKAKHRLKSSTPETITNTAMS